MLKNIATGIFVISGCFSVLVGVIGLLSTEFTPYHEAVVGHGWEQIEPRVQSIILAMQKIEGGGFLGCGFSILMLLIPIRRGEQWAHWAAVILPGAVWIPALITAIILRQIEPSAPTPVVPSGVFLGLLCVGVGMFIIDRRRHQRFVSS